MTISATEEQNAVISESGNCVVVARPGSGKTFTISEKVRRILPVLPEHKGVIAISFTNKASDELESRCTANGFDSKASFFGTIDKFLLTEIILPFAGHIWGTSANELEVVELTDEDDVNGLKSSLSKRTYAENLELLAILEKFYKNGEILLDSFGFLGLYIFKNSVACRRYLKARYTYVFIDEYQDCDEWQHNIFVCLTELGLCGVAVGDPAQSIFAFARKDSKYLTVLAQEDTKFNTYPLTINHRCHPSIVQYSTRLLSASYEPTDQLDENETNIYEKWVNGSEIQIAKWISQAVDYFADLLQIESRREIAVLVNNSRTGNLIHNHIQMPHKSIANTPLDRDSSLWGSLFRKILSCTFDSNQTKRALVEKYLDFDFQTTTVREVIRLLTGLKSIADSDPNLLLNSLNDFFEIARLIFPNKENDRAKQNLTKTLSTPVLLEAFIPAQPNEVQLLTLHKSKGLEFDLVFHLDMYKYILPKYKGDFVQDLNLHYVGITRARKCTILCGSTHRHKSNLEVVAAEPSEFFHRHDLQYWRLVCPI